MNFAGVFAPIPTPFDEHDRVDTENHLGVAFRILTGFPPRYFLRLDPRQAAEALP
jgi:hypothetical protein